MSLIASCFNFLIFAHTHAYTYYHCASAVKSGVYGLGESERIDTDSRIYSRIYM